MDFGGGAFRSLALLVGNAFFVAAEFALISAKRHRLEQSGAEGSRAIVGIAALEDLLEELIGDFDDETDTPTSTTPRRRPGARG